MSKLLLIIDYQNDFVQKSGKLTAGEPAQAIEPALVQRIKAFQEAGADVICTLDTHTAEQWKDGHPESTQFPLHCADQSKGWKLYGALGKMNLDTLTKTSYMLDHSDLDWIVRQYDSIELAGVTTDICVLQNAIGLYNHAANLGRKIHFSVDAACVASFDLAGHDWALGYFSKVLGFEIRPAGSGEQVI